MVDGSSGSLQTVIVSLDNELSWTERRSIFGAVTPRAGTGGIYIAPAGSASARVSITVGGLVARSACHYGTDSACVAKVRHVFTLAEWVARYEPGWDLPGRAQQLVQSGDERGFVDLMVAGRLYLEGRA